MHINRETHQQIARNIESKTHRHKYAQLLSDLAADIHQNKPLTMHLLKGEGHENRGNAADIPKT